MCAESVGDDRRMHAAASGSFRFQQAFGVPDGLVDRSIASLLDVREVVGQSPIGLLSFEEDWLITVF